VVRSHFDILTLLKDVSASRVDSIRGSLKEDLEVICVFSGALFSGVEISDHKVELNVGRELDFVKFIGLFVSVDGDGFSVAFETEFLRVACVVGDRVLIVFVDVSLHERGNEFKESSLRSISLNGLINEISLVFFILEPFSDLNFFGSFRSGLLVPFLSRGEGLYLNLSSLGHFFLNHASIGSELEDRGSGESESSNHNEEIGVSKVVLELFNLLLLFSVSTTGFNGSVVGLVVDLAVNRLSRDEHVTEGHSVLSKGTGLI